MTSPLLIWKYESLQIRCELGYNIRIEEEKSKVNSALLLALFIDILNKIKLIENKIKCNGINCI